MINPFRKPKFLILQRNGVNDVVINIDDIVCVGKNVDAKETKIYLKGGYTVETGYGAFEKIVNLLSKY